MGMRFLHSCIRVGDLEKSVEFYKSLGFYEDSRKEHYDNGFALVFLKAKGSDFALELTYNVGVEQYTIGDGYSHLAIGVDDLEAEHQRYESLGYEVTPIKGLLDGPPKLFFVTDPDGYKVEVLRNK